MYKVEITEVVPGSIYAVLVTDDKTGEVQLDCEIQATSAEDAEQFVIHSFKSALNKK